MLSLADVKMSTGVCGMDSEDASVFDRTVSRAIPRSIETATFHVLTPYPGIALFRQLQGQGRLLHRDSSRSSSRRKPCALGTSPPATRVPVGPRSCVTLPPYSMLVSRLVQ
jgi:hypothetical protein